MIQAALSALLFYLMPLTVGRAALTWSRHKPTGLPAILTYFSLGSIIMYGLFLGGLTIGKMFFPIFVTPQTIRMWTITGFLVAVIVNFVHRPIIHINKQAVLTVSFIIALTIAAYDYGELIVHIRLR